MVMRTMPAVITVLALALAVGAGTSDAAQQTTPPLSEGRPARPPGQLTPGDVVGMLDNYAAIRAQEALALDDAHFAEFVSRLRTLQQLRRRNQQAHNRLIQDLRRLAGAQTAPPYDEGAIRERLKALREQDDRAAVELRQAYDAVDEVLDVRQQARFRIFEEMMERRKLDLLMRAQNAAARKGTIQP
jgi:hypothetical protein